MQAHRSTFPFLLKPAIVHRSRALAHMNPAGQAETPTTTTTSAQQLPPIELTPFQIALSTVGMGVAAFHGYRRNNSVGWAIVWGLLGAVFPVITNVIAFAEGYAKPASGTRSLRSART